MASLLLLVAACGNRPPATPVLVGPSAGQPGETLAFRAVSVDPEGGDIAFRFDWGDSSPTDWTPDSPSGDTFLRGHCYDSTGDYPVTVQCRDRQGLESVQATPRAVTIAFNGPFPSGEPAGPDTVYADTAAWFVAAAGHVRGDSVSVRFDWAGVEGAWTAWAAPGEPVRDSHTFDAVGDFQVRFHARDRAGNQSPWSPSTSVVVRRRPLEAPNGLRLGTSDGAAVVLHWDTGNNGDSARYAVWFRPLDQAGFQFVLEVAGDAAWHDPGGATGWYTISARQGGVERFAAETLTTVPVYTDTVLMLELNAGGPSGYGWDTTGHARLFAMTDTASAAGVDFYYTDRSPGSSGPAFFLSSPHLGPEDPGATVPRAPWRHSGMNLLWGQGQEPLPPHDTLLYSDMVDVTLLEAWIALYTESGRYALVNTICPAPESARVRLRSWYQPVPGLRLLRHVQGRQ